MGDYTLDQERYAALARRAAAEGCVLVKNDNAALPLKKGERVAVFGRIALDYYKSGLGSGGLVNTRYVTGILDALQKQPGLTVDEELLGVYEAWCKTHPFDVGSGWGQVPWSQEEMPLAQADIDGAAARDDAALVVIGRTAGEDQDNKNEAGSYLLTETERDMIERVSRAFARTIVLLNVGNIIDMKWVEELSPAAVMYVWQGGQEGGNGVCDVLTGRVNPCGKLADTIAADISDYPSNDCFGDAKSNSYREDIYVGYRYFETFARDRVLYPFGFGLSYTTFSVAAEAAADGTGIAVTAHVKNTGDVPGKEVVQVYIKAPQGKLGKPERALAAFAKTEELQPGQTADIPLAVSAYAMASYDDSGITGHKSCYVLEAGVYEIYVGTDVRNAVLAGSFARDFAVVEQLREACAPVERFDRMRPLSASENGYTAGWEAVPLRTENPYERLRAERMAELSGSGDQGFRLGDVVDGKTSLEAFTAQLSDEDLVCLFRGEGMCSPKVTPGTGAAFGGLTESLRAFGIPAVCCTDGPSGLRFDCGTKAFSLPNGTLLGCTFNLPLVEELYRMLGLEMRKNRVDALLGPGMNIHRHPLNGRNFEYVSEDPLLTGKMGAAQIAGMEKVGVWGTAKHFCANNQESNRRKVNAAVSERALREIYLKGFEIAVKEGGCRAVMTTYGPLNGIWTAGNYDLIEGILRGEWGFDGFVMTDWWAESNVEGEDSSMKTHAPMVAAGNDVYMVTNDGADMAQDDVWEKLQAGEITRGDLQRNAMHILNFVMKTPAMLYELGRISEEELAAQRAGDDDDFHPEELKTYTADEQTGEIVIDASEWDTAAGKSVVVGICAPKFGRYDIELKMKADLDSLAQLPVTIFYDNAVKFTVSIRGTEGAWVTETRDLGVIFGPNHYLKFYFGANGLLVDKIVVRFAEAVEARF